MNEQIKKLLEVALAEEGYFEKNTNSQLDSKTANPGYNNYTKYARDLDATPNFYNGKKQGVSWCDIFVDWCFVKAFGVAEARRLTCQPLKSFGAGCNYSANYYKQAGRFHAKNPKVGDQIFFWNTARTKAGHTGIVIDVDDKNVYTIEGNTSAVVGMVANGGNVRKKSYPLNYNYIYGYGRPDYKGENETVTIELPVLKKNSSGEAVETLQRILSTYGYKLGNKNPFDGKFGAMTETALKAFQAANKLPQTGEADAATWNKLFKN